MSASQEKRNRKGQKDDGFGAGRSVKPQASEESKSFRRKTWIVVILVVVFAIAAAVINSNLFYTGVSAVDINGESYTTAEFNYFYKTAYYNFANTYSSYFSYLVDTSKPLSEQQYSSDMTWDEYFQQQALSSMELVTMLCDKAQESGFELDEESLASIESDKASVQASAGNYGYTNIDSYLAAVYGRGFSSELLDKMLKLQYTAEKYQASINDGFTYTSDEIKAYYAENKDTLDVFDYSYYLVPADTDDSGAIVEGGMDAAKVKAEQIAAAKTQDEFTSLVSSVGGGTASSVSNPGSSVESSYSEWMLDASCAPGDTNTIEMADRGYYVIFFQSRSDNNYYTKNVRHILVKAVAESDGTYSDEALATAKESIDSIYAEWQSGDATEDSFAALANEKSEDAGSNTTGGLYENVYKGQMVDEFNSFCFDSSRAPGDTGIVFGSSSAYEGYHLIYYVGDGELYCDYLADSALRSNAYTQWQTAALEGYTASTSFAFKFAE